MPSESLFSTTRKSLIERAKRKRLASRQQLCEEYQAVLRKHLGEHVLKGHDAAFSQSLARFFALQEIDYTVPRRPDGKRIVSAQQHATFWTAYADSVRHRLETTPQETGASLHERDLRNILPVFDASRLHHDHVSHQQMDSALENASHGVLCHIEPTVGRSLIPAISQFGKELSTIQGEVIDSARFYQDINRQLVESLVSQKHDVSMNDGKRRAITLFAEHLTSIFGPFSRAPGALGDAIAHHRDLQIITSTARMNKEHEKYELTKTENDTLLEIWRSIQLHRAVEELEAAPAGKKGKVIADIAEKLARVEASGDRPFHIQARHMAGVVLDAKEYLFKSSLPEPVHRKLVAVINAFEDDLVEGTLAKQVRAKRAEEN